MSIALNGGRRVAPATRRLVEEAAELLGYSPSLPAVNLRKQRAGSIGILIPDVLNPFFMELAVGVEEVAREHQMALVFCPTNFDVEAEEYYARLLAGRQLDGVVVISGTGKISAELARLAAQGRLVFADEKVDGVAGPLVATASREGAGEMAGHVLAAGHSRIGVIAGPPGLWTANERLGGIVDALAERGLEPVLTHGDFRSDSGYEGADRLMQVDPGITAVMAVNDLMALGALRYFAHRGIGVGTEISLTGFDDIPAASLVVPGLATVRQPAREIGRLAASMIFQQMSASGQDEARTASTQTMLEATPILRGSLGTMDSDRG